MKPTIFKCSRCELIKTIEIDGHQNSQGRFKIELQTICPNCDQPMYPLE